MRETHTKQIVSVILIGTAFTALFAGMSAMYFLIEEFPLIIRAVYGGLMAAMALGMIHVLRQRIEEIRKGENDDLGNY